MELHRRVVGVSDPSIGGYVPDVVGIRFQSCGKVYDFEANGMELKRGDMVIVESDLGLSIGRVVHERHASEVPERQLKPVLRKASEDDLLQEKENIGVKDEARLYCAERIMARGLPMKLVGTDVTLDRKRLIFYFVAGNRVDFRELVKDLAAKFKTRIELRQIGVRDEAKIIGSFGICGRELCCRRFLTSFEPISIKMAKQQELALNTAKLSGACGRLMCCLGFEYGSEEIASPASEETVSPDKTEGGRASTVSLDGGEEIASPASEETASPDKTEGGPASTMPPHKRKRHKRNRWRRAKGQ